MGGTENAIMGDDVDGAAAAIGFKLSDRVGGSESVKNLVAWALEGQSAQIVSESVVLENKTNHEATTTTMGMRMEAEAEAESSSDVISVFTCVGDVKEGEEVFHVPSTVFLRAESQGKWRTRVQDLKEKHEEVRAKYEGLSERDRLSLRLLLEFCDSGSHWGPYIAALPKEDPCLSSWDAESLVELKDTPIWKSTQGFETNMDILGEPSADLVQVAFLVKPSLCDGGRQRCTREAVRWCHQMVMSRAFGIKFEEDGEPLPTLVPVVDLLDHSNDAKVSWRIVGGEGGDRKFVFKLDKPVKKGMQLFTNYGAKGNEELLRGYGFTLANNPHDFYVIELGIGGSEMHDDPTAWNLRLDLLHRMECKKSHALTMKNPFPLELLAAATICILPQPEVYHFHRDAAGRAAGKAEVESLQKWLRTEVDNKYVLTALEMLQSQINRALEQLCRVSTIEEDESKLYSYTSYASENRFRHLMAIHYRLGLKRILREAKAKIAETASGFRNGGGTVVPADEGHEGESGDLEVDLGGIVGEADKAKVKLMVALNLPLVHYFGKGRRRRGAAGIKYLSLCIALSMMKASKLEKIGSGKLLESLESLMRSRSRLQDKMHHYQTPLPEAESRIRNCEKDLEASRASFLGKLRRSAMHPKILKKASVLVMKSLRLWNEEEGELCSSLQEDLKSVAMEANCWDQVSDAVYPGYAQGGEPSSAKRAKTEQAV